MPAVPRFAVLNTLPWLTSAADLVLDVHNPDRNKAFASNDAYKIGESELFAIKPRI